MNKDALNRVVNEKARLIDAALQEYQPEKDKKPIVIYQAMRYSVFAGGKRIRPVLFLAAAEAVGGVWANYLPAACAIELIHTYSLIHDDLPAMDNDDYRRGRPSNHRVFGEAIAILAGDALLTMAFGLIAECGSKAAVPPAVVLQVIAEISAAAGPQGMIGGQVADIQAENSPADREALNYIHAHKTGALFKAAVRSGAIMAGGAESQLQSLSIFAENLGLAFQITDDILDIKGDFQKTGKTIGSDQRKKKCTYPVVYGLAESRELAAQAIDRAVSALTGFGEQAAVLRGFAYCLLDRDR
jgi:geranylgeranyl diphosphate synthase type II